jgi:endoglucanase
MREYRRVALIAAALAVHAASATSQGAPPAAPSQPVAPIRLNQVGFLPDAPKVAVVVGASAGAFTVESVRGGAVAMRGTLSPSATWPMSGEAVRRADFTALRRPGRYVVVVPGVGRSTPFEIGAGALRDVARGAIKSYYYQRTGIPLDAKFAGRWARAEGHPDTIVLVHSSAASATRPEGTRLSSPRGWYDAGDYNKYIVNSGISTYTLLLIAEQFPRYAEALRLGIPETGNGVPDVLNEALWNIRWMLTMQDPADGGVYHKLTNADFDAFIAPEKAVAPRYVVQKSTAATLDFAAVMAHASIVTRRYERQLPGLSDSLTRAALAAWRWGRQHPDSLYDQSKINASHKPPVSTGTYGDRSVNDEMRWAAAELMLATKQDSFVVAVPPLTNDGLMVPTWGSVGALAVVSLVDHRRELGGVDTVRLKESLLSLARSLRTAADSSPYGVAMAQRQDFAWGSNAVAANQGLILIQAARVSGDTSYLRAAASNLDYILGRNATGYSFVTGYGARTPMFPHHRPSAADTIADPIPGLLVGGPNPSQQDRCKGYPPNLPALSYIDAQCSYASNEVAINWNAPFAYLVVAVDAMYGRQR